MTGTPDGEHLEPAEPEPALTVADRWWAVAAVVIVLAAIVIGSLR